MKLLSFSIHGQSSFGLIKDQSVIDLKKYFSDKYVDLKSLLAEDNFLEILTSVKNAPVDYSLEDIQFEPVIPNPEQIFCIGLNYADHVQETQREITEKPMIFFRLAPSQVGHNQPLLRPVETEQFDYEGEIAIVIGKGGRRIPKEQAWDHIAGYSCYNDGSVRDWQRHTAQWGPGKNFFQTGGFGPWLVTTDEIKANETMTLITRVNGQELQRAQTTQLIHDIPSLINYISTFTPLSAGDVIVSGTPGGIGLKRNPPVLLQEGDIVEIEVDKVGILKNIVKNEG
ncbi:fumarylacetoacetate hydrolase family protein [Acinetobacter sp. S40]|uniref:fumarylacetoacetate hydrolase family protein n=1 Tax=unclassified Acinetobacter TaxID=196816 RepID=UPI001909BC46|nr:MULTISPECIES: fumarylacetoacetate hydrolase family protein [unclassified Acinetobacter]MBJ9984680.1 fumarylacetoacetate hydrolase family protein [Acinetobacter sp. S40]MBK0062445.1 fumarylacetoacetate hydrolase family protein [Acinetobacter sp. S55]MBK0066249.1 fumarylacetoacetate hydrolase family protein [Acinetobacter sp. S54]